MPRKSPTRSPGTWPAAKRGETAIPIRPGVPRRLRASFPADVADDFKERAGVDVVEIAEDVHLPRRAIVRADEGGVVLQGGFIVGDAYAAARVQGRDVEMMFMLVGADDAVGRETGRAAIGVMNDDDVLNPEQVLGDGNGSQSVDGATAGDDDRKDRRR